MKLRLLTLFLITFSQLNAATFNLMGVVRNRPIITPGPGDSSYINSVEDYRIFYSKGHREKRRWIPAGIVWQEVNGVVPIKASGYIKVMAL